LTVARDRPLSVASANWVRPMSDRRVRTAVLIPFLFQQINNKHVEIL
jgi:hypothetical protein